MIDSTISENHHAIYIIENTVTGKLYVGRSNKPKRRKNQHFRRLKKGVHHSKKLQIAYDRYGRDCFKFSIIDEGLSKAEAIGHEKYWIDHYDSQQSGYNVQNGSSRGMLAKMLPTQVRRVKPALIYHPYAQKDMERVVRNLKKKCTALLENIRITQLEIEQQEIINDVLREYVSAKELELSELKSKLDTYRLIPKTAFVKMSNPNFYSYRWFLIILIILFEIVVAVLATIAGITLFFT